MRKIFSFLTAILASVTLASALEITVPATTLDLQDPSIVTTAGWTGEKAYYLDDDVLIVSGYEAYKSVAKQTWITFLSTGSSSSTWSALDPFKGSDYYTTKSYATLQSSRYTAYLVTNCDSVWAYGCNNAATAKYLVMNVYEITGEVATINTESVEPTYSVSNEAAGKADVVLKQALDATKKYLVVTTGAGASNSRSYETAFFRHSDAPKVTYTVAGNSTAVFGTSWDPSNKANDMKKLTDGSYKWEKENLALAAGDILFKVCQDHAWTTAYPADNYKLTIAGQGKYTITITFDPNDGNKVSATATKTGDVIVMPTIKLNGNFTGGADWAQTEAFELAEDSLTASLKMNLNEGTYPFGVLKDDTWCANATKFTRENPSSENILPASGNNMSINADQAGEYIFTWTFATNALTITYPKQVDPNQMYLWNGNGVTKAEDATEKGGAAEAVQADGTNIAVGVSQKGNWCLKANKGFNNGAYYLGIAMDNAVNAGDTIKIAYFRTASGTSTYVMGMDFSADKASASTTYQILSKGDPQYLGSNGIPADSIFIVPEGVANAKYMRIYRNSGGTGLWVSKVEIVKAQAGPVPPADPTAQVWGSFNEWAEGLSFILATDKKSASLTANIKKGDYNFKMMINGEWRSNGYEYHRGFPACAGISTDNTNNMIFKADVDGDYTFTWTFENDSINIAFPEKPAPVLAKYYVTGDSALVVDAGLAAEKAWDPMAIKSEKDTLVLNLKANQEYKLKLIENGDWEGGKVYGYDALTEKADGLSKDNDGNIVFKLNTAGDVKVVYFWENVAAEEWKMTFKLIGDFYVKPAPVLANGYYLVGKFGGVDAWSVEDLSAAKLFAQNLENEGEYFLADVTLAAEDSLKVVYVENDAIVTWYPKDANYGVDAKHAGTKTIYFRPDGQGGDDWFYGTIYIAPNGTVGITNTEAEAKAVKTLRNGILVIEKNGKAYNVIGLQIR